MTDLTFFTTGASIGRVEISFETRSEDGGVDVSIGNNLGDPGWGYRLTRNDVIDLWHFLGLWIAQEVGVDG